MLISEASANIFLSTLSLRRATRRSASIWLDKWNFYPRSPCGERPALKTIKALFDTISIHALLAESDKLPACDGLADAVFLSTLSLRRATPSARTKRRSRYFYPRSPCGERPITCCLHMRHAVFLSTLSLRRATLVHIDALALFQISIHALLAESDRFPVSAHRLDGGFLSTLSLRRATAIVL